MVACFEALESRSNPLIPAKYVMEVIEAVLDNNNFSLGKKHYVQTDGVAIGSRLGRIFACSYMRKWDEDLFNFRQKPYFYKRYIDDGFGIWTDGLHSLQQFAAHANTIHENIKVELRWSKTRIEFLDTWVILDNNNIKTDLYMKPIDKQLYLQYNSCHPVSTKKSLAYGLGILVR